MLLYTHLLLNACHSHMSYVIGLGQCLDKNRCRINNNQSIMLICRSHATSNPLNNHQFLAYWFPEEQRRGQQNEQQNLNFTSSTSYSPASTPLFLEPQEYIYTIAIQEDIPKPQPLDPHDKPLSSFPLIWNICMCPYSRSLYLLSCTAFTLYIFVIKLELF